MAHITLSIPDEVYEEMKAHPEIKWSEIARQSIIAKSKNLRKSMPASELLKLLPSETAEGIKNSKDDLEFAKKSRERSWKRAKYLTQA